VPVETGQFRLIDHDHERRVLGDEGQAREPLDHPDRLVGADLRHHVADPRQVMCVHGLATQVLERARSDPRVVALQVQEHPQQVGIEARELVVGQQLVDQAIDVGRQRAGLPVVLSEAGHARLQLVAEEPRQPARQLEQARGVVAARTVAALEGLDHVVQEVVTVLGRARLQLRVDREAVVTAVDVAAERPHQVGLASPRVAEHQQDAAAVGLRVAIDGLVDHALEGLAHLGVDLLDVERIFLEHRVGVGDRREHPRTAEKRLEAEIGARCGDLAALGERLAQVLDLGELGVGARPVQLDAGDPDRLVAQPADHRHVALERLVVADHRGATTRVEAGPARLVTTEAEGAAVGRVASQELARGLGFERAVDPVRRRQELGVVAGDAEQVLVGVLDLLVRDAVVGVDGDVDDAQAVIVQRLPQQAARRRREVRDLTQRSDDLTAAGPSDDTREMRLDVAEFSFQSSGVEHGTPSRQRRERSRTK
jgi:hypothetical protein